MQYGFYNPSDWEQCAFVDMICETYNDYVNASGKIILFTPEEEKHAGFEGVRDGILKKLLNICEKRLEFKKTKYIGGDNLTIADFCLSALIFNYLRNDLSPAHSYFSPMMNEVPLFCAYADRLG